MIGAARCQQKILKQSPPDQPDVEALRNEVRAALLAQFPKTELASLNARHAIRCMGSSGSVRALARLGSRNTGSEREFSAKYLGRLIEELSVLSREEIAALPNIEPRRADLILSAAIILEEILRFFSCEHVQATSHALKDGILAELLRTQLAEQSGLK